MVAPPETAPVSGPTSGGYGPVPGLAGAIQTLAGSNITATVSAEVFGNNPVVLRARMDGVPSLTTVTFMATGRDDVRSFAFVFPNVSAGQHNIEIDWQSCAGCTPQMRDRTRSAR